MSNLRDMVIKNFNKTIKVAQEETLKQLKNNYIAKNLEKSKTVSFPSVDEFHSRVTLQSTNMVRIIMD